MTRRFDAGATIVVRRPGDAANGDDGARGRPGTLMFVVSPTGQLRVATAGARASPV